MWIQNIFSNDLVSQVVQLMIINKFFLPSFFNELATVEPKHWWFRSRIRILLWVLKKHGGRFENFLEVGCGTGFVLQAISEAFPGVEIEGTEYFDEGLVHARKRVPSAKFKQLDARDMDIQECYDFIGAFDVIEHINEDELVLNNMSMALKPGGELLLTVPQHGWLWSAMDEHACHIRRYSRSELLTKITKSGLTVEYMTSFVSLLVPLMYIRRLWANSSNYDPMDEFRIPGWLNSLLEMVMSFELLLLKIGIRTPIGGSLLMLAKKK